MTRRIVSVDLGQSKDPAALIAGALDEPGLVLSRIDQKRVRKGEGESWLRDLAGWVGRYGSETVAILDGTGPHRSAALWLARPGLLGCPCVVIQIRPDDNATSTDPRVLCVNRSEITGALQWQSHEKLWRCPGALENADELRLQLQGGGYHDDLVMALAMALWLRPWLRRLGESIPIASEARLWASS